VPHPTRPKPQTVNLLSVTAPWIFTPSALIITAIALQNSGMLFCHHQLLCTAPQSIDCPFPFLSVNLNSSYVQLSSNITQYEDEFSAVDFETFDIFLGYFRGRNIFEDMIMHIRINELYVTLCRHCDILSYMRC
jgi:hypothetical protein